MRRDLPMKFHDGGARRTRDGANPGASARGRYAASPRMGVLMKIQSRKWGHAYLSIAIAPLCGVCFWLVPDITQVDLFRQIEATANCAVIATFILALAGSAFALREYSARRLDQKDKLIESIFDRWHSREIFDAKQALEKGNLITKGGKLSRRVTSANRETLDQAAYLFNFFEHICALAIRGRLSHREVGAFGYFLTQWWNRYQPLVEHLRDKWEQPEAWHSWEEEQSMLRS